MSYLTAEKKIVTAISRLDDGYDLLHKVLQEYKKLKREDLMGELNNLMDELLKALNNLDKFREDL